MSYQTGGICEHGRLRMDCEECTVKRLATEARQRALLDGMKAIREFLLEHYDQAMADALAAFIAAGGKLDE